MGQVDLLYLSKSERYLHHRSCPGANHERFLCGKPDSEVTLKIEGDVPNIIEVDKPSPPCVASVSSFLGNNFKQEKSRPDNDTFNFAGMSGDEINLRLESDTQAGNNGGSAGLNIRGSTLDESTSGTPPLELDVILPEDGEY